jgi:peptide/nickel transport system permease protein
MHAQHPTYWQIVWKQFCKHRLGVAALIVILLFVLVGIYVPLLASSKPLVVEYQGNWYFPLFRYLFYPGFFTKRLDIFYNLLMFTFPFFALACTTLRRFPRTSYRILWATVVLQCLLFLFLVTFPPRDPAVDAQLNRKRQQQLSMQFEGPPSASGWQKELEYLTPYGQLNRVLRYQQYQAQQKHLQRYEKEYEQHAKALGQINPLFPTLWNLTYQQEKQMEETGNPEMNQYLKDQHAWLEAQTAQLKHEIMPLLRPFHWEEDAGGDQVLNHLVDWWNLTRINRKDMVTSLLFGVRISLSVGLLAIALALSIGIPVGALAGYYGGKLDLIVYRLIEIWESMPTFFMLLMVVAFLQSKSIFLIIAVIGLFGWTGFSRFVRGEFFRQKELLYVEACRALGYPDRTIIFSHLLPNSIPPLLTLVPFAIMGAITSEAGLSFLGLGEEGSNSWGILMDEGRSAFPSESYLLWPPAILLTLLLVAIALVGDTLRDALDPKLHTHG